MEKIICNLICTIKSLVNSEVFKEKFSTAAMTKSRKKLSYLEMEEILSVSVEEILVEKTWKNYQLLALDGMVGELPKTKELMKKYHNTKTAAYPKFHAIALYDV